MNEPPLADLEAHPKAYKSSKGLCDILEHDDIARPLIVACGSGDHQALEEMLSLDSHKEAMKLKRHCIYHADKQTGGPESSRLVLAMPLLNIDRAVMAAGLNDQTAIMWTLADFAVQQEIKIDELVRRQSMSRALRVGNAAIIEALARADPKIYKIRLFHGVRPLYEAVKTGNMEVLTTLIRLGASPHRPVDRGVELHYCDGHNQTLLSRAVFHQQPDILKLLLTYDLPIAGSYALHEAAALGHFENMRILIEHGADVNEALPPGSGWTPMHHAAWGSRPDSVDFLVEMGARTDILDSKGRRPSEVETWHQWRERDDREREEKRKEEKAAQVQAPGGEGEQ